jgi:hypothetical protein
MCLTGLLLASPPAGAEVTVGVIGDSLSSEYDVPGGGFPFARNWVEQFAAGGNINFGPTGFNGPPRGNGYAYNWAQGGDTSATMFANGQVGGLTAQIPSVGIDYAVMEIGSDDIGPGGAAYSGIYNGTWTQTQINNEINTVVANVKTGIDDLVATGVKVVVATAADHSLAPAAVQAYPIASQRQLVSNVIGQINQGIIADAQTDHVVVADLGGLQIAAMGIDTNMKTTFVVGNMPLDLTQSATANPSTAAWVGSGTHPNSALQGVMANMFAQALNEGYNAGVPLLSEQQMLAPQGLTYGGSDTVASQIGPYSNFVFNYAPTPPGLGDANHDGVVNGQDISLAASNWLKVASNGPGDVNGDGIVNGQDIALIASNWLNTYGGATRGSASVPEPSTWLLASVGCAILALARRRRGKNWM